MTVVATRKLLLWVALLTVKRTVEGNNRTICQRYDANYVPEVSTTGCFDVGTLRAGLVSYSRAQVICSNYGHIVDVQTKAQLSALLKFAISDGLKVDSDAGFWTIWKREITANLSGDGTLSPQNEAIRKNRTLYVDPDGNPMPVELWRNESQPGHFRDARDEMCTAQSRPGKQPEYLGIDDYECNGTQLHYALCHVLV
ncbi:uncharacterized protein LOC142339821 [Convolutriloba macropyga]|uniref:uncharacterized protein LOC142339821 n=1 Tax=Convolutriloba macropyga TaxID=536237 RepID=UPI003F51B3BE